MRKTATIPVFWAVAEFMVNIRSVRAQLYSIKNEVGQHLKFKNILCCLVQRLPKQQLHRKAPKINGVLLEAVFWQSLCQDVQ